MNKLHSYMMCSQNEQLCCIQNRRDTCTVCCGNDKLLLKQKQPSLLYKYCCNVKHAFNAKILSEVPHEPPAISCTIKQELYIFPMQFFATVRLREGVMVALLSKKGQPRHGEKHHPIKNKFFPLLKLLSKPFDLLESYIKRIKQIYDKNQR